MAKAKQKDVAKPKAGASKVASAISKAIETVDSTGNLLIGVLKLVASVYRGADVPAVDLAFIVESVGRNRNWTEATTKTRGSEIRKVVRNYRTLPDAMARFCKKSPVFQFHHAVTLARLLNGGATPNQAATQLANRKPAKVQPSKQLIQALTRIQNIPLRSPNQIKFRKALNALMRKHKIELPS